MGNAERLLKLIRYVLVYRPDEFGLLPDGEGFVRLKDLHAAIRETEGFRGVRRGELENLLEVWARDRFEYRRELGLVRPKEKPRFNGPEYTEDPPLRLYLPVKPRAWIHLCEKGWNRSEQALMTPDKDLGERLARRKGALLIEVDTVAARKHGSVFFRFLEKLYLSPWLPAEALRGPKIDEKFLARYSPKPKPEPKPEPIVPFRPETPPPELPYRKITRGKKKKVSWKIDRKKKKKGDW